MIDNGENLFADPDFASVFPSFSVLGEVTGTLDRLETELAEGEATGNGFVFVFPYDGSVSPESAEGSRVTHPETGETLFIVRVTRLGLNLFEAFMTVI